MRVIKPQRLSLLQRVFEVRGERRLAVGVTAYLPLEAPDRPLPEISMWQELPKQVGKDVALDEVLPKPRGEFLVFGKAFAPEKKPRPAFQARVSVGPIEKPVYVIGKRRWVRDVPSEPEPLTELLLGWEKAFGGPDYAQNPLGMGLAPKGDVHELPQLEDPKRLLKSPKDKPPPAAFGPIDVTWAERQSKAGTYDAKWLENDFPGFARDINPEYFMSAPVDQRLPGYFAGGEPILLENLHPDEPRIESRAPELIARVFLLRADGEGKLEDIPTRLDTLVLLPNVRRMVAIFRGIAKVTQDDAADVSCLLAALEKKGEPKGLSHYQKVLEARLDKKKGHLVALRDRDLMPEPDPNAKPLPDEKFSDMEDLLAREGIMEQRGHKRAQRELDDARRSALVLGVDPDEKGIPREIAPPEKPPKLDDLADYMEKVEDEVAKLEAEGKQKQDETLEEARKNLAEHGIDLDQEIERAKKEGGGPPKFRAEEHLSQMRETARIGRELGAPMEEFEAQIEDPTFQAKLRSLEETQLSAYRQTAHLLPPATPLSDEARNELRVRVIAARDADEPIAGWDLTGADLSGLDFRGANLAGALLEGASLEGAELGGTNLAGAVLARANIAGAKLEKANLSGANLGDVRAKGAKLAGANLGKAILWNADLSEANFAGADLRAADLLDAQLKNACLEGATCDETLFYQCDLEGAKMAGASLKKATLFRCRLTGAQLDGAVLENAALVEVKAEGASLVKASAKNLRLVLQCALDGADLSGAELGLATMRGATMRKARLEGIRGEGCDLSESDLREARLEGAWLKGARLMRTELGDARLDRAMLMEAMLQNAKVAGTSFAGANLFRATMMGAVGDDRTSFAGAHVVRTLFPGKRR